MKILSCEQIRKVDEYTITNEPIESVDLMERAAEECSSWIKQIFGDFISVKIFVGPGNNGGDGLAIARLLADKVNTIEVYMLTSHDKLSNDALINYMRLSRRGGVQVFQLQDGELPEIFGTDIVVDAMFGSGITRSIEGYTANLIRHINESDATVIAIDLPSGLFGEDNRMNKSEHIIEADYTLTFQMPKLSFFFAENEKYLGEWLIMDIGLLPEGMEMHDSKYVYTEKFDIIADLKKRPKHSHKGTYGHALLISGSYGKMGASVLASRACLKAGVGLLTSHIPSKGYEIIQSSVPEAMVSVDPSDEFYSLTPDLEKYSAIGIGPGLGLADLTVEAFYNLITTVKVPMVIDADGLNILARHTDWLSQLPKNTILTPHPGEFDRLAGKSENGYNRYLKQVEFSKKNKVIVVLKGAYTSITVPDGMCYFNSTGNPGMATAGSGDALTGIILSLLAQNYKPIDAARIGVFIHGLAGDLALTNSSEESVIASDIINNLGPAFRSLKNVN
jgi:NAD(P)H-hydrate epimerase